MAIKAVMIAVMLAGAGVAHADSRHPVRAEVCVGYNPLAGGWGFTAGLHDLVHVCPSGHAVISGTGGASAYNHMEGNVISTTDCCPMPTGLLTARQVWTVGSCPPDSVVTGFTVLDNGPGKMAQFRRCTFLDGRFQLGAPRRGDWFGITSSNLVARALGREDFAFSRSQIPASVRYGVRRVSQLRWESWGCVGTPLGSLLVGADGPNCQGMLFAQVFYRNAPGEDDTLKAVEVIPRCDALDSPYSPNPRCLTEDRQ